MPKNRRNYRDESLWYLYKGNFYKEVTKDADYKI